tara:strand:+ start:4127 stop:4273 length:147 start_codon:yes stop_codon:yes gene_type:complete
MKNFINAASKDEVEELKREIKKLKSDYLFLSFSVLFLWIIGFISSLLG